MIDLWFITQTHKEQNRPRDSDARQRPDPACPGIPFVVFRSVSSALVSPMPDSTSRRLVFASSTTRAAGQIGLK
jgi:hypothetical protein